MKLCQKCVDAVFEITGVQTVYDLIPPTKVRFDRREEKTHQVVPESDCEFWAHKELNDILGGTIECADPRLKGTWLEGNRMLHVGDSHQMEEAVRSEKAVSKE